MRFINQSKKNIDSTKQEKNSRWPKNSRFFTKKGKQSIGDLIQSREWSAVRKWLFGKNSADKRLIMMDELKDSETTCLHVLCLYHPPLILVMKTVEICPEFVYQKDNLGRLPLHIAAGWGASPNVISFLLAFHIDAAATQDINGKTPLIWAFENMKNPRIKNDSKEIILADSGHSLGELRLGPVDTVVSYLADAALESVILKDQLGNTALDYAIENECNRESVNLLQLAVAKENQIQIEINSPKLLKRNFSSQQKHGINTKCNFHPLLHDRIKLKKESTFFITSEIERKSKKDKKMPISDDQFNVHVMEILGVSNNQTGIDEVSLSKLREINPDCVQAAKYGFKASKHYRPQSIPLIVEVENVIRDDISEIS